jgi:ATP-binding cassette subfamily A (ABC1) protein 3
VAHLAERARDADHRPHDPRTPCPSALRARADARLQFLDEADLLGDTVAVLAAPGKLVAQGTPVQLKAARGGGYALTGGAGLLAAARTVAEAEQLPDGAVRLGSRDPARVAAALRAAADAGVENVDVRAPSLEGVFLALMEAEEEARRTESAATLTAASEGEKETVDSGKESPALEAGLPTLGARPGTPPALVLTPGRPQSFLAQTRTVFYKRALIARRGWLTPLLAVLVAVGGACVPLVFIHGQPPGCTRRFAPSAPQSLWLPASWPWLGVSAAARAAHVDLVQNPDVGVLAAPPGVLAAPPGVLGVLGNALGNVSVVDVPDNATFGNMVNGQYRSLELGGVSFDFGSGNDQALFAWEASAPGTTGLVLLNLVSNVLHARALNHTGAPPQLIAANYESFPYPASGVLVTLKWVAFFGAAMVRAVCLPGRGGG